MKTYVGIDVSKNKIDVCWLRDNQTRKRKSKSLENSQGGHQDASQWILNNTKKNPQDIVIVLEPTGVYHEAITYNLFDSGYNIFLVNTGKAKQFANSLNSTHKTDHTDALTLAEYGYANHNKIKFWQPESLEVRQIKILIRRLDALEKDLQREKNRAEAYKHSISSDMVIQSSKAIIEALESEITRIKKEIDQHINQSPTLNKNRNLLESIQGVGPVISRELVYLFSTKKFNQARDVAAYLGLIPRLHESGNLKGKTSLSKKGPSRIRAKLFMAAIVATQHNPLIRTQKERLIASGKTPKQAIGAAMRKLVQICYGVVKHQTPFEPDFA